MTFAAAPEVTHSPDPAPRIALYYDDSAYLETLERPRGRGGEAPAGLMGRLVAGKEFLDAYLSYGGWSELVALTPDNASRQSIVRACREHPSSHGRQRRLQLFSTSEFHDRFLPSPPAPQLYFPCPPDPRFAWARGESPPHSFALSGVTHTLCSARAVEALRNFVTAPWEPYDRLICTSRAVNHMVRAVTDAYAEHLRERFGGQPRLAIGLETIPLGVNTERFQPATAALRSTERRRFHIAEDELAVLFVGRLSHHAKAHPFPMFRGVAQAAKITGKKVHLLMVGWAADPQVLRAFEEAARTFAPGVRVSFFDGVQPEYRFGAWRAADLFISLSDNLQETFGLVIVEAMASGLPVVASDWNGYRDLIQHGETGFLVPTTMLRDATSDLTSRLLFGELNYDHFLAQTSQSVLVDCDATTHALVQLFENSELRRRLGQAGRQHAVEHFSWRRVIAAYESLWRSQDAERIERQTRPSRSPPAWRGPAAYPAPESSFGGYPSVWLDAGTIVQTTTEAADLLPLALASPLVNHEAHCRSSDPDVLKSLLEQASRGCTVAELERELQRRGAPARQCRTTLAWLLKYDLLRVND